MCVGLCVWKIRVHTRDHDLLIFIYFFKIKLKTHSLQPISTTGYSLENQSKVFYA